MRERSARRGRCRSMAGAKVLLANFDDHFNLDSIVHWQRHADSTTGVLSRRTEDFQQQIATAMNHTRRVVENRARR